MANKNHHLFYDERQVMSFGIANGFMNPWKYFVNILFSLLYSPKNKF